MIDKKFSQLKPKELRLIGEDRKQIGVLSFDEARQLAEEKGLDLILVAERANPPVAKLGDLKKALYEQEKKRRRLKQARRELKEVRISLTESPHDLEMQLKKLVEFLGAGHPVQIRMPLKGRQKLHRDFAKRKMQSFLHGITVPYKFIQEIKSNPWGLTVVITK